MASETLTLCFLGERTYLQGTTLFEALVQHCRGGSDICFKLSKIVNTDRVSTATLSPDAATGYAASLSWSANEERCALGVTPLPPSKRPHREPFDEAGLIDLADFRDRTAQLNRPSPFSTVQTVVALNKALLTRTLKPPGPVSGCSRASTWTASWDQHSVLLVRYRSRYRFAAVSSEIDVDGKTIGEVLFSWLPK